jgi:hypothetical protein
MANRLWLLSVVVLVGLCLPSLAHSATWKKFGTTQTVTNISPGSSVVYDFVLADGTGFGPILQNSECATLTIQFDPDSTGGAARVYPYACIDIPTTKLGTANVCGKILVDTDADGILNETPMTGTDGSSASTQTRTIYDISGQPFIAPYISTAAAGVERARLLVSCVPATAQ